MRPRRVAVFAILLLGGCFAPDLGQGQVRCGQEGSCPPGYRCHGGVCLRAGTDLAMSITIDDLAMTAPPDLAMTAPPDLAMSGGDLASCRPTARCGDFCGTVADDGCGHPLRCECDALTTCSAQKPNSCACVPAKTCNELPPGTNVHCGTYPDGCGGTVSCGCGGMQICGQAAPYTCGNQPNQSCSARLCKPGECGIVPDNCTGVLDCHDCPFPKVCGGGGTPNLCH